MPRISRLAASALLVTGVVLAPARPAFALACSDLTPALDEWVTCSFGSTSITVPAGAGSIQFKVIGGGGGGSEAAVMPAAGGRGAVISGTALLPDPMHDPDVTVIVGAGGAAGTPGAGNSLGAGGGGRASAIFVPSFGPRVPMVIAGGGGGAGGRDIAGDLDGAGGDAGLSGLVEVAGSPGGDAGASGTPMVAGGGGANGSLYGMGASGSPPGASGQMPSYSFPPTTALGGAGAQITTRRGGDGGGGYAGGGGGAASVNINSEYIGGGGGGGSSYLPNPQPGPNLDAGLATVGPGVGGTGHVTTDPGSAEPGEDGEVTFKFLAMVPHISSVLPTSGSRKGGGLLTISGTGLTGATEVTVGGVACPIVTPGSTTVTCTIPAGSTGAQDVKITTAGGPDTLPASYTYTPEAEITGVSPSAGRMSGGETLTISGLDLTGTNAVVVGNQPCTSVQVASAVQVTCQTPASLTTGVRDVAIIGLNGNDTESNAFTYLPEPTITKVEPAEGGLAGGETITITGTELSGTTAVTIDGTACAGTGPHHAYATTSTTVTCIAPAAVNGSGVRDVTVTTPGGEKTLVGGYRYAGPPVIASVLPTVGPQAGGNPMTILGGDLGQVVSVLVGGQPCASVAPTDSTLSCVVPSGASPGKVDVAVSASAGVDIKPSAYEYLPAPPTPQPTTAPTTTPPASPTPTPTTPAPTTPAPTTPPQVNLALAIRPGAPVSGSSASVSGGGLRANSQYVVTLYSSPVRLASGYADENGVFKAQFKLPARACVKGGLHRVVLSGFAPDGTVVTATNWLLFDDTCTTRTVSPAKPATVTYGTFRFDRASAVLTPYVKGVLNRTHSTLTSAKQVTITGYTQTGSKGEVAAKANKALALKRAQAARDYLRKLGVKAPITVVGAGAVNPLKGRPQSWNRRVFITVRY